MTKPRFPAVAVAGALLCAPVHAAFPPLAVDLVVDKQFQSPTAITHAGDGSGRLFVCEQRGRIHIVKNGVLQPGVFLDIGNKLVPERNGFDERGLLGLAFHPQFGQSGQPGHRKFYVFYSTVSPNAPGTAAAPVDCRSVVAEYSAHPGNAELADPTSERILLQFDKPQFNHNGGQLAFGPDGFLYIGTGDGGSSNDNNAGHTGGSSARPTNALGNSQDLSSPLGKILRIAPLGNDGPGGQYGIPADNPLVGTSGALGEIWAYGLRNPWRFSFDRTTGRLFCADVGQGEIEEIDIIIKGGNYGWRNREGTFTPTFSVDAPALTGTVVDPIGQYAHPGVVKGSPALPQLGVSITGGFLYRGAAIPALQGKYVCGDYSQDGSSPKGVLIGLEETTPGTWSLAPLDIAGGNPIGWFLQTFGEDEAGEIYLGAKTTRPVSAQDNGLPAGVLLKLVPAAAPVTASFTPQKDNSIFSEGSLSNAKGLGLFAGNTQSGATRRALLKFDLSSIPASATVTAASLTLTVNKEATNDTPVSVHRLLADWGEGTSQASGGEGGGATASAGDATWTQRFVGAGSPWTAPGGDFVAAASSTLTVPASNTGTWTGLAADVQGFVTDPATNFGWIVRAGETTAGTAKKFNSREVTTPSLRPSLSVTYTAGGPTLTRRQQWEQEHFFTGQFIDPAADPDADRQPHLLEYAWDRDPQAPQPVGDGFRVFSADATTLTVKFLRDPRATDLTYRLESSTTLTGWGAVLTSVGGAQPTGIAFSGEVAVGAGPLREVTAVITHSGSVNVRLAVQRP